MDFEKLKGLECKIGQCRSSIEALKKYPSLSIGCPSVFCNFSLITKDSPVYHEMVSFMIADNEKKLAQAKEELTSYINQF